MIDFQKFIANSLKQLNMKDIDLAEKLGTGRTAMNH